MCNLVSVASEEKVQGWKVVAVNRRTGKYHSVAMGFAYSDNPIPKVKKQKRIGAFFTNNILSTNDEGYSPFKETMVGRTAVFVNKEHALSLLQRIEEYGIVNRKQPFSFDCFKVVEAEVSVDLMQGWYGPDEVVVAGRRIKFIEE